MNPWHLVSYIFLSDLPPTSTWLTAPAWFPKNLLIVKEIDLENKIRNHKVKPFPLNSLSAKGQLAQSTSAISQVLFYLPSL